ncbi:MAG: PorT family protein [Bacteroidota bacterium]|nr:PorT family protein [Bacteroidota bacterium]
MKKLGLILATFLLLGSAYSQKIDFGLNGGLNISTLHINDQSTVNSKAAINLGFFFRLNTGHDWAISPALNFSMEGAKVIDPGNNVVYRLNYLNIPVLLQYQITRGLRLEGGPQMGFLLGAKAKTGSIITPASEINSTAFSLPFGVSYTGKNRIGFDARYNFGLSNLDNNTNGPIIQSNVFQLDLIYMVHNPHRK